MMNVYVSNVLIVTETNILIYPTGTFMNPGIDIIDRGRINLSITSLHKSYNGYIDDFKIYNRY
jgi:hypothetical protein